MEKELEYQALEELHQDQRQIRPKTRVLFIIAVIIASILMIIYPTSMPRLIYNLVMLLSMMSIFGIVFNGRVALMLTKRRFKDKRPHRRLAELSEPDDLDLSIEDALKKIAERQEKELQKRGLR